MSGFGSSRNVKVELRASVSDYVGKITAASKATRDFAKAAEAGATKNKAAWEQTGKVMAGTGIALAAGLTLAVKAFADFDKEMSTVRAVSGATTDEMNKLRVAALKAGADTAFSASEAAKAEGELAKVGISTSDILGGALIGSMNLAAAGTLDLGRAAEISGQAMKIFHLAGSDVGRIADALASGANKSAADVEQLGQALQQGGLVAAQTGLTMEDTIGTLSAFADNALMSSDAGTSLKTMLSRLNPTTEDAAQAMEALGLQAYDARGNFVGIDKFAGQLKTGLKDLTVEQRNSRLQTVFGSDAVRAATILYDLGEKGVRSYIDGVSDQGAAARVAGIQMDNLAGDLEALKGSFETALIQSGSVANDSLRTLTQTAADAVNWFGQLPTPIQKTGVELAGVAAAGLLGVGAFVTIVPKIAATKTALAGVGTTAGTAGYALRGLAGGAVIAAVALPLVGIAGEAVRTALGDMAPGANAAGESLLQFVNKGKAAGEGADLINYSFEELDRTIYNVFSGSAMHQVDAIFSKIGTAGGIYGSTQTDDAVQFFKTLDNGLSNMAQNGHAKEAAVLFDEVATAAAKQGVSLAQVKDTMPGYTAALDGAGQAAAGVASATALATGVTKTFADTQGELKKKADDAKAALDTLLTSIEGFGSKTLDARGAARDYEAAIDAASKSIKDNGKTLDKHTEKGRANQQALEGIATTTLKSITANYQHGASVKTLDKQVADGRKTFLHFADGMGLSKTAAGKLADALGLTKRNVDKLKGAEAKPKVTADTGKANTALLDIGHRLDYLDGRVATATVNVVASFGKGLEGYAGKAADDLFAPVNPFAPKNVLHPASGGYITGAGSTTSDSIPAMLSNKEYVSDAATVAYYGVDFFHDLKRMRFASGGYVGGSGGTSTRNTTYDQPVNIAHATFTDGRDLRAEAAERRQKALRQT